MKSSDDPRTASYVVGAYAASPAHREWHPELEHEFFEGLEATPQVGALELPWLGRLHPHDDEWLHQHFPARLTAVITDIGHVMSTVDKGREYGLASLDDVGRHEAIVAAERLRSDVRRFNDRAGRKAVSAIELHSAPRASGAAQALSASLEEIGGWDWDGAQLLIEHCDAFVEGQRPEKGFLSLDDEITAIRNSGAPVKVSLNWGRSAIELRDPQRVTEHVRTTAASGLLEAIIFSGAADREGDAGYPWIDAHHAFAASPGHPLGDPTSLLTDSRVGDAFVAAVSQGPQKAPEWLGVKVGWAHIDGTVTERVRMIQDAVAATDHQWNRGRHAHRGDAM